MVCRVLAHDFKITKENSLDSEEIIIDPSTIPARSEGDEPRPITHTYTSPANTFYITSMAKSSIETHALSVIGGFLLVTFSKKRACNYYPHPTNSYRLKQEDNVSVTRLDSWKQWGSNSSAINLS